MATKVLKTNNPEEQKAMKKEDNRIRMARGAPKCNMVQITQIIAANNKPTPITHAALCFPDLVHINPTVVVDKILDEPKQLPCERQLHRKPVL